MNKMNPSSAFMGVSTATTTSAATPVQLQITGIHEFLNADNDTRKDRLITLSRLIGNQADMHEARAYGDWNDLDRAISKRQHLFRGFIVHAEDGRPAAYCVYYPMVDKDGKRAAYCEDIFIVEAWRGYGIFNIVLSELARRTKTEELNYVQWSTDARNKDFLDASHKKGIMQADIQKVVCPNMLDVVACTDSAITADADPARYFTRPLTTNDMYLVNDLGFGPDIITRSGDVDFRGFVTFSANDRYKPVAIIPGWKRLSTFTLHEGIVLEGGRFAEGHDMAAILLSVADATRKTKTSNVFWHVHGDEPAAAQLHSNLNTLFGAHPETMAGTDESTLLTHILREPELSDLAHKTHNMLIMRKNNAPIGAKRPVGVGGGGVDVSKRDERVRSHHAMPSNDLYGIPMRRLRQF